MYRLSEFQTEAVTKVISNTIMDFMIFLFGDYDEITGFSQQRIDEFIKRVDCLANKYDDKNIFISNSKQIRGNEFVKTNFNAMYLMLNDKNNVYTFNELQEGFLYLLIQFESNVAYRDYILNYIDITDKRLERNNCEYSFDSILYCPINSRINFCNTKVEQKLDTLFISELDDIANMFLDSVLEYYEDEEDKAVYDKLNNIDRKAFIEEYSSALYLSFYDISKLDGREFYSDLKDFLTSSSNCNFDDELFEYIADFYGFGCEDFLGPLFWDDDYEMFIYGNSICPIDECTASYMGMTLKNTYDLLNMSCGECVPFNSYIQKHG